jgi:hypothetical protein
MAKSTESSVPKSLFYEWVRTLFGPRPSDNNVVAVVRPVAAGVAFSAAELLPWSMPWQNIKAGTQINPLAKETISSSRQKIIAAKGYAGLLSGASPEMMRQIARQFVRMVCVTYLPDSIKTILPQSLQTAVPLSVPIAVGLTTATIEVGTTFYFEALKTHRNTKGLGSTAAKNFNPFQGIAPTAARQWMAWPLLFVTNKIAYDTIKANSKDGQISYTALLVAAPISSAMFVGLPNLFDVIKTHQQQANNSVLGLHKVPFHQAPRALYKQAGLRGLFSGALPSIIQRIPAAFFLSAWPIFSANEKSRKEEPATISAMIEQTRQALFGGDNGKGSPPPPPPTPAPSPPEAKKEAAMPAASPQPKTILAPKFTFLAIQQPRSLPPTPVTKAGLSAAAQKAVDRLFGTAPSEKYTASHSKPDSFLLSYEQGKYGLNIERKELERVKRFELSTSTLAR